MGCFFGNVNGGVGVGLRGFRVFCFILSADHHGIPEKSCGKSDYTETSVGSSAILVLLALNPKPYTPKHCWGAVIMTQTSGCREGGAAGSPRFLSI